MKELFTTSEAAEYLGVTDSRIRQLILAGLLPADKFGNANLIKIKDLKAFKKRKVGRPKGTTKKK